MTVQIAAIRIIKAPFIQGMLVQYCRYSFSFAFEPESSTLDRLPCFVRLLICSDLHSQRKFQEDYC